MASKDQKIGRSKRRVTIKDIAVDVGVSTATVSYVLNESASISKDVKSSVMEAATRLGYRANTSAKAIRTGKTKLVGLVLPDISNPFYPKLAQAFEKEARKSGMAVILADSQNSRESEIEVLKALNEHNCDGIAWCSTSDVNSIGNLNIACPVVMVDRAIAGYDSVVADYFLGGKLIADFINRKEVGSIGIIHGPLNLYSAKSRLEGLVKNLEDDSIILWKEESDFSGMLSKNVTEKLDCKVPSMLIAGNDMLAIAAIKYLENQKTVIPDDVEVIGFDDISWSKIVSPALTTIKQPTVELGIEAFKLLHQKMEAKTSLQKQITLSVEFVERESTR